MRFREFINKSTNIFSDPPSKVGPVATDIAGIWKLEKPFFVPPKKGNAVSRRWKTNPMRPAGELHKSVGGAHNKSRSK